MHKIVEILQTDIKDIIKHLFDAGFNKFYNLGVDAFQKQDYNKAIEFFKLAIKEKNVKPQVYYNLARTYQSIKNTDKAITAYKKFLELNPKDYDGIFNIALVYLEKENYSQAIVFLKTSLEIKLENENIKALALAYICNNETQKAIEFAEDLLESAANGIDYYFQIAKVFESKNPFSKDFTLLDIAIEMYSKITQVEPQYFEAFLAKSICYAKKGEWENSVTFCAQALSINPDSYEANNQMGLVYYCCDKTEAAIKYYEQALNVAPQNDFKIYSNLAYAYEKIGNKQKATKTFTKMLATFDDFPAREEIKNHLRLLKHNC